MDLQFHASYVHAPRVNLSGIRIILLVFYKISDKDAAKYAQANAEKMQQSK